MGAGYASLTGTFGKTEIAVPRVELLNTSERSPPSTMRSSGRHRPPALLGSGKGWQKPCHNAHRSAVSAPRRHASAWRALGRTAIRPGGELGTVRPWPTAVARRDRARASVGGYVGEIGLGIDAINLDGCFATNLGLTDGTALLHAAATDPGSGS
jgi:hypothetical protein